MKKHLIFILVITLTMLFAGCSDKNSPTDKPENQPSTKEDIVDSKGLSTEKDQGVFEGDKVKDFYIEDNSGNGIHISRLVGKTILLNFWASWSLGTESMNTLISECNDVFGENINIVSINVTAVESSLENILKHIETNDYQFPIYFDLDGKIAKSYLVRSFPTTYIIDTGGYVDRIYVGEADQEEFMQYINSLIEAKKR